MPRVVLPMRVQESGRAEGLGGATVQTAPLKSDDLPSAGAGPSSVLLSNPFVMKPVVQSTKPPTHVLRAVYALCTYTDATDTVDEFLGTCVAVSPCLVLTAGHHFTKRDEVERFCVVATGRHLADDGECTIGVQSTATPEGENNRAMKKHRTESKASSLIILAKASYIQKAQRDDVLIVWLDRIVPFHMPLRSHLPRPGTPIWTLWLRRNVYSTECETQAPGVVMESGTAANHLCCARGSVTDYGSSGAPVVCGLRGDLVGIHVSSNYTRGLHKTEFVPARTLVELLEAAGVDMRRDRVPK